MGEKHNPAEEKEEEEEEEGRGKKRKTAYTNCGVFTGHHKEITTLTEYQYRHSVFFLAFHPQIKARKQHTVIFLPYSN